MNIRKIIKIIIGVIGSIILGDYVTYFINLSTSISMMDRIIIFSFYIIIGIILFYYLRKQQKKISHITGNKKVTLVLVCTFLTIITLLLGRNILIDSISSMQNILIIPLEDKNPMSQGKEIWILDINDRMASKDLNEVELAEGWEYKDKAILSYQEGAKPLNISLYKEGSEIVFLKHNYSGKVRIIQGNNEMIVDLYSSNGEYYKYDVNKYLSNEINRSNVLRIVEAIIVIYLIYLLLGIKVLIQIDKKGILYSGVFKISKNKKQILSAILFILLISSFDKNIVYKQYEDVDITLASIKTTESIAFSNEVWILDIIHDGKEMDLSKIKLPEGWEYRNDSKSILTTQINQPIDIKIPGAKEIEIKFKKHDWSGEVLIQKDGEDKYINLCNYDGIEKKYEEYDTTVRLESNKNNINLINIVVKLLFYSWIIYALMVWSKKKSWYYIILYIILWRVLDKEINMSISLKILGLISCMILLKTNLKIKLKEVSIKNNLIEIISWGLIIASLLIHTNINDPAIKNNNIIATIILLLLYVSPIFSMYYIKLIALREKYNSHKTNVIKGEKLRILYLAVHLWLFYVLNIIGKNLYSNLITLFIGLTISVFMNEIIYNKHLKKYNKISFKIAIVLIAIYTAFAWKGHELFFRVSYISLNFKTICILLSLTIWLMPLIVLFIIFLEKLSQDTYNKFNTELHRQNESIWLICLICIICSMLVYQIIFFPANMTPDSIDQWAQAIGDRQLNDWHPVVYTLMMRLLINIWKSPAIISLAQIVFFALVGATCLNIIYKKGINKKILILFAIIFPLIPSNGNTLITIWKDIPYTISLLWSTYILCQIVEQKNNFLRSKLNCLNLILNLISVALFRHNGIVVLAIIAIGLVSVFKQLQRIKVIVLLAIVIGLVQVIKGPIYGELNVTGVAPGTKYCAMTNDMIGVLVSDEEKVELKTKEYLLSLASLDTHYNTYTPFNFDEYIFNQPDVLNKMGQQEVGNYIHHYLNTFIEAPLLLMQNRLNGMELMWNISQAPGSFNYRGDFGSIYQNEYNLVNQSTEISNFLRDVLHKSYQNPLLDSLIWRTGIYIVALLIIGLFLYLNRKELLIIFLPLLGNILSLGMSMYHQSYRYVWFIFVIFWFILSIAITVKCRVREK